MAERTRIGREPANSTPGAPNMQTRLPERGSRATPAPRITIDSLLARIRDLPTLPSVVIRVLQMTGQEGYSAREISQVISKDPMFTARILKLANSAHYGLPRKVGTVSEAAVMMGNQALRNVALVAATYGILRQAVPGYELEVGDLWRHSLACGFAAEMLAQAAGYAASEEAFVGGLLHDVGKTVLGLYVREGLEAIQEYSTANRVSFLDAERAVLGFDHADVGARLARLWNLPPTLVHAIASHHGSSQNGDLTPLTALVHVANAICLIAGIGVGADGLLVDINTKALQILNLDESAVEHIIDRLVGRMDAEQAAFALEK